MSWMKFPKNIFSDQTSNFDLIVPKIMQAYTTRSALAISFQTLSHERAE